MKSYSDQYSKINSEENLYLAFRKSKKGKSNKSDVKKFEKNLEENILELRTELLLHSYKPKPLKNFIIRDPKTRKISKSDFRDRIIHHALCNVIEPIFDRTFISDSYANRKGKGTIAALERFDQFKRKVSRNGKINGWYNNNQVKGYCLKADIKHYFEDIDQEILLKIIKKKIKCSKTIWLIKKILDNYKGKANRINKNKGMPLGNLTSQFFANIYLNELDKFVKHKLKAKYYIRYVDDFVILHSSKQQLIRWKEDIDNFLKKELKIELHPDKSKIISLNDPINFVGFRVFYYYKLLKKFNRKNIYNKLNKLYLLHLSNRIDYNQIYDNLQGSFAYMKHANTYKLRKEIVKKFEIMFPEKTSDVEMNRHLKIYKESKYI
ncbi:MAG: reverse transcriptase domain-containing protein [Candidatus Woesearchaeota archaeon]